MVKEELVEGLKTAMIRGDSLQKAMFSFYNAGYKKAEIEEAARLLQSSHFSPERYLLQQQQKARAQETVSTRNPSKPITPQTVKEVHREQAQLIKTKPASPEIKVNPAYNPNALRGVTGGVSTYQSPSKTKTSNSGLSSKWVVIALAFVLLGLIGAIAYIFFFKPELLTQLGIK